MSEFQLSVYSYKTRQDMKQNFKDQVILITGASMGIGKELAFVFAKQKAKLVLAARKLNELEIVAQEVSNLGGEALIVKTDVTKKEDIHQLLSEIEKKYGKLDILINNAGKGLYGSWQNTPSESNEDLFDLNFFSLVELTRKTIPLLKKNPSHFHKTQIINIASIASFWPVPKMGPYCASKAALHVFSNILRIELKKEGIHVLCVYPGIINTGFSENAPNPRQEHVPEDYKTKGKGLSPQKLAQKILKAAATHKKREYVTFSNRLLIKSYQHLPSFFEWIMQRFA